MKSITLFALFVLSLAFCSSLSAQQDDPETPFHDQQVTLIKKGRKYIDAYQKAFKKKHGKMPKLNFREAPLAGVDFRGMNLENAIFIDADLRGAMFGTKPSKKVKEYDNEGRLISGKPPVPPANARGANFSGADMGEHNLKVADLSLANFENANISMVDLTGAKMVKTNFRNANLSESSLIGCNFRKADLTLADLTDADVENCTFDRTIIIRTKMEGINADEAVMKDLIRTEKQLKEEQARDKRKAEGF